MQLTEGYFGEESYSHPHVVKQRKLESIKMKTKQNAKTVSISVLSKVLNLD